MRKIIILMSWFVVFQAGCSPHGPETDLSSSGAHTTDAQSCYYKAKIIWSDGETSKVTKLISRTGLKTLEKLMHTSYFSGVTAMVSGHNDSYVYLDLIKPCTNSFSKAKKFFEVYKRYLKRNKSLKVRIGTPEQVAKDMQNIL